MAEAPVTVLKFGGATCRDAATRKQALEAVVRLARQRPLLIVPGGGEFADQVRVAQREQRFSDDAAHWMAILAMDQMAHLIAHSLTGARVIHRREEIATAHEAGELPVLAPYAWMRIADPLPHSWDVTGDSIAAFVAGDAGARELILLKPVAGPVDALVDPAFAASCPPGLRVSVVTPATLEAAVAG